MAWRAGLTAMLLGLERPHLGWELSVRNDIAGVDETPTTQRGPVREIQIFRQRIGVPTASVGDRTGAPFARRQPGAGYQRPERELRRREQCGKRFRHRG